MRLGFHPGKLHESDAAPTTSASIQLLCSNRADSPCRLPACGWHASNLEQLKSECLDLGQYAVQRGLIRGASQQRVLTLCLGVQGAALVWVLAFGYAFSWVFATIGLVTRNPEARNSPPPSSARISCWSGSSARPGRQNTGRQPGTTATPRPAALRRSLPRPQRRRRVPQPGRARPRRAPPRGGRRVP
jgi:hypothetical protein